MLWKQKIIEMINKDVVYFPYINLNPNNDWYKSACLYWESIKILTPQFNASPFEGITKKLHERERPFVQPLYIGGRLDDEILDQFIDYVSDLKTHDGYLKCYHGKFASELFEMLQALGLAYEGKNFQYVEGKTAKLYLSLVAYQRSVHEKYDLYTDDLQSLDFLNYGSPIQVTKKIVRKDEYVAGCLESVLPVPRATVTLDEIMDFKNTYYNEFDQYRSYIERKFRILGDVENLTDERFENLRKEITEYTNDSIRSIMVKEFSKIKTLTLGFIDIAGGNSAGKILKAADTFLDNTQNNRYQYLGLVEAKLG